MENNFLNDSETDSHWRDSLKMKQRNCDFWAGNVTHLILKFFWLLSFTQNGVTYSECYRQWKITYASGKTETVEIFTAVTKLQFGAQYLPLKDWWADHEWQCHPVRRLASSCLVKPMVKELLICQFGALCTRPCGAQIHVRGTRKGGNIAWHSFKICAV